MKKFFFRFLLFLIFIPSLVLMIFQFNFLHFLLLNVLIIVFSLIGAFETKNFFKSDVQIKSSFLMPLLSCSFPILAYFLLWFPQMNSLSEFWIVLIIIVILIKTAFFDCKNDFSIFFPNLSASISIIIYPGLLLSYLIRILEFKYPSFIIILFLGLIFGNDISAYLGGKFLGKKTRLNLKISPNKTLIGFISGIVFSVVYMIIFYYCLPQLFNTNIFIVTGFAILIAGTTIIGDLIESAMKRAVTLKDSGTIMMGRGGILDSIDSILISAPVFYFIYPLIAG